MFEIINCSVKLNEKLVLKNLNFQINDGERIVILGINGSGKTTLLKALNGLITVSSGEILYNSRILSQENLNDSGFNRSFRKEVVLLFQNIDAMLFNPSVFDEIAFGLRQSGIRDVEEPVRRWASTFGLDDYLNRPPFELSGGEKKKVALASIMAVEPSTFLLDEPTSQLDPASSAWLMELLNSFKDRTIISTTHNLSIVGELGDRVIVLSRDRDIIFDGPPAVLLSDRDLLIRSGLSHSHLHRHEQEIHTHYHVHDLD